MAKDIEIIDHGLVPYTTGEDRALGFVDPVRMGEALALCDYGIEDEITTLLEIIESGESPKTRMQAMSMLNNLIKDSLKLSGRIAQATATNEYGETISITQVKQAVKSLPGESNDTDEQGRFKPVSAHEDDEGHAADQSAEEGQEGQEDIIDVEPSQSAQGDNEPEDCYSGDHEGCH